MLLRALVVTFLAATISTVNAVKREGEGKESLRYYLEKPLKSGRFPVAKRSFARPFITYQEKKAPGLTIIRRPIIKKQKDFITVQSTTVPAGVSNTFAELSAFLRAEQISDIDSVGSNALAPRQPDNTQLPVARVLNFDELD